MLKCVITLLAVDSDVYEIRGGVTPQCGLVLSPNLRIGLKQNFVAKSGILGFLILFGRFLFEKNY